MGNGDPLKRIRIGLIQACRQYIKALPVIFTKPESFNSSPVGCRTIPLIAVPAIMRKFNMKALHILIPPGLGQNAGCSNRSVNGISFYDTIISDLPARLKPTALHQ